MQPELEIKTGEHEPQHTQVVVGLEGTFGCGKSHIGNLIAAQTADTNHPTQFYKLGGLGDDLTWLKEIKAAQQEHYEAGQETPKQQRDRETDRVYHLAAVKQSKTILRKIHLLPADTLVLLDRTPFVGYAYTMALNDQNPYLSLIYERNLSVAKTIGMDGVILFDLPISESYARAIARYFVGDSQAPQKISEILTRMRMPGEVSQQILERTMTLIQSGNLQARPYDDRHFIPYDLAVNQRRTYQEALDRAQKDLGFKLYTINADQPIDAVMKDTVAAIDRIKLKQHPQAE